jgi:hypothetical protein
MNMDKNQKPMADQLSEAIKNKDRANLVFLKLLARQKKPKNPFDVTRSYTPPSIKEIKPGVDEG